MNKTDPTLDRIRETRKKISENYGHNVKELVEHYIELQKQYKDRIIPSDGEESSDLSKVSQPG